MIASPYGKGKGKDKGNSKHGGEGKGVSEFGSQPQVHYITSSRRAASVPISEVLTRLHIEVDGAFAVIRGTRTSFRSLACRGSEDVYLADGTPLWQVKFRSQYARRPPKPASTRLMHAQDWRGCLLICTSAAMHAAHDVRPASSSPTKSAPSTAAALPAKYGPCRYGASCREKDDPGHCANYSHPERPSACAMAGCVRPPSGGYATCCAQCRATGGTSHSPGCFETALLAILVVEDVTTDGQSWVVHLRSLSHKAASAAARLCRYDCGMMTCEAGGKAFDTCCKQCAVQGRKRGASRIEHDAGCAGPAADGPRADFQDTVDLNSLLPLEMDRGSTRVPCSVREERPTVVALQECRICFNDDADANWCSFSHSFCKTCMSRHVEEELVSKGILPACPLSAECGHLLSRDQVEDALTSSDESPDAVLDRFDLLAQRLGLQALGAFPCARETCQDWIVPSEPGKRQLVECPRCEIRFCALCKRKPFHWRVPQCKEVAQVDEAWHQWLGKDRDEYIGKVAAKDPAYIEILEQLGSKKAEQLRMLAAAKARKKEFDEMETWKETNCKCCPKCKRVINKVDGCDSMVCGRNYHGGDVQNGCGTKFNWASAPCYVRQEALHMSRVAVGVEDSAIASETSKQFWRCKPGVYLRCAMCKFAIRGPLFLCVDCVACCACLRCANGMGSAAGGRHDPDTHVFCVLWKPEDLSRADLQSLEEHRLTTRRLSTRPEEALSPWEVLIDMGYSESQAQEALSKSGGSLEAAVALLLG
eukprot:TRINITY_DN74614_c0_g1_i1.p1 TRINITY_DN74614_c0_g1~~TRINITY_DN74614_c0_g1_i1.p1  ORF type:complete len:762 (-),score=88.29 TRINITY_DN74614_c0_g1_i1:130-2415(-)